MDDEFLGGPPRLFERVGREQAIVLLEHGLTFESTVLDIGCGVLRGGRWIIPLLKPSHYCGIEPQRQMVERGLQDFVDQEILALKSPRFDYNDRFDFSVFDMKFSHFLARSIWTHASKAADRNNAGWLLGMRNPGCLAPCELYPFRIPPASPTRPTSHAKDGAAKNEERLRGRAMGGAQS
jgi:SAM-dependent methyltransferase